MKKQDFFFNVGILFIIAIIGLTGCKQGIPKADFSSDKTTGAVPLTVQFSDNSTIQKSLSLEFLNINNTIQMPDMSKANVINKWEWNFGDGNTSIEKNPTHIYNTAGQYTVSLKVTTNSGKTDTVTKQNYINVVTEGSTEGEGTSEGSTEGTTEETMEGEPGTGIYVWGTGENWQEGIISQASVEVEDLGGNPTATEIKLHPLPEYSTGQFLEHEAVLYLMNFNANVAGTILFLEYPKAGGSATSKVWHMVTNQYAVRLIPPSKTENGEKASADSAMISMVVGSQSQIPAGFNPIADLYIWRGMPGIACEENGTNTENPKHWFNLTNGHSDFIYISSKSAKGTPYQSICYPVGNKIDCPDEAPANFAVITTTTTPKWQTDLQNNQQTKDWLTPPPQCPATPPSGYRYEYQGRTVVVDKVCVDCTLPGLNDNPPRDYKDETTDVTLIRSTTQVSNMVTQNDIIVGHTWKLVSNP